MFAMDAMQSLGLGSSVIERRAAVVTNRYYRQRRASIRGSLQEVCQTRGGEL